MAATAIAAGAVSFNLLAALTRPRLPDEASAWLALVGIALVGTVLAVTAFFAALALLGPSDTAVVSTVEPVVSIAVAGLVLGERLSPSRPPAVRSSCWPSPSSPGCVPYPIRLHRSRT